MASNSIVDLIETIVARAENSRRDSAAVIASTQETIRASAKCLEETKEMHLRIDELWVKISRLDQRISAAEDRLDREEQSICADYDSGDSG